MPKNVYMQTAFMLAQANAKNVYMQTAFMLAQANAKNVYMQTAFMLAQAKCVPIQRLLCLLCCIIWLQKCLILRVQWTYVVGGIHRCCHMHRWEAHNY
jgi:hypothetical protein